MTLLSPLPLLLVIYNHNRRRRSRGRSFNNCVYVTSGSLVFAANGRRKRPPIWRLLTGVPEAAAPPFPPGPPLLEPLLDPKKPKMSEPPPAPPLVPSPPSPPFPPCIVIMKLINLAHNYLYLYCVLYHVY